MNGNYFHFGWIYFTLISLLYISQVNHSHCQSDSPYQWRYWNVSDGLKEEYCSSLVLAQNGKIWVNHGYSRTVSVLDGFDIQSIQNPDRFVGNVIPTESDVAWAFAIDQNSTNSSQLYIGLQRFMNQESQRFHIPEIQNNSESFREPKRFLSPEKHAYHSNNFFKHIPIDSSHVLVVLPTAVSVFHAESESMKQVLTSKESGLGEFNEIIRASGNSAWIGTEHGAAKLVWNPAKHDIQYQWEAFPFPNELQLVTANHLVARSDNTLYATALSTQNGHSVPLIWNGRDWILINVPGNQDSISDLWPLKNNDLMMLTLHPEREFLKELLVYNEGKSFTYTLPYKFKTQRNFKPQIEPNGNCWINLFHSGIARGTLKLWRKNHRVGNENTSAHTMDLFPNHGIAFLFSNQIVTKYNNEYDEHKLPGEKDSLFSIMSLNQNTLVCLTSNYELLMYQIQEKKYVPVPLPANRRYIANEPYESNKLLLTLQHEDNKSKYEIVIFDGSSFQPFLDLGETKDIGMFYRGQMTQSGEFWICGQLGLRHYSAQHVLNEKTSSSFPGQNARFMLEIGNGIIWLGCDDGLFQFDGVKWETIKSDIVVRVMRKAMDGSIWIISPDSVYRYYKHSWVKYSDDEGLSEIQSYSNIMEDHSGVIWLSTSQGIYQYDPNADVDSPRTVLDELRNAKEVTPDGNTLILFDGIDKWKYTPKDRLLYSYKVDQEEWSSFQESNSAYLQNLSYGSHTFQVRAMDRNLNIDPTPAQFQFSVMYPWYLHPGFVIVSFTLISFLVFRFVKLQYLVRLRTARLKEEMKKRQQVEGMVREVSEREQRRIGQDLHDGLSQLLAGTRMLTRRIFNKLEAECHPEAEEVKSVQHFLEQSSNFTRDLIRGLTPISLGNKGLNDALQEFALNIEKMFDITCYLEIHTTIEINNSTIKTNVYRIIQEAVNNAIKHGKAKIIAIKMYNNEDAITVSVQDNGNGLSTPSEESTGMGLEIMKYRASLFQGTVQIHDINSIGVEVICTIPRNALSKE